jgi:hypothetical protein
VKNSKYPVPSAPDGIGLVNGSCKCYLNFNNSFALTKQQYMPKGAFRLKGFYKSRTLN